MSECQFHPCRKPATFRLYLADCVTGERQGNAVLACAAHMEEGVANENNAVFSIHDVVDVRPITEALACRRP